MVSKAESKLCSANDKVLLQKSKQDVARLYNKIVVGSKQLKRVSYDRKG